MPQYSKPSNDRLNTAHPDLITLFNYVIKHYDNTIVCGHRGEKEQNEAYRKGNSKLKWPHGKHNKLPSEAIDSAPFEVNAIDWKVKQSAHYAGYVMGVADTLYELGIISHRIRSGADWDRDNDIDDTIFWDAAHFEIIPNKEG